MAKTKSRRYNKPKKSAPIEFVLVEAVPVKPERTFDRVMAVEGIGLLLLPLIAFWAMRFIPINQNGYLDPYIYTGYIHDFQDLIARYGLTYYSVRFGMIIPAQAFAQLFGPVGGYLTLRYVLALTAGIPLYYMVKHRFSRPIAAMTVVGLLTSPYFARALLWDYPDAAGVPFLIAAISLFLLDDPPSLWRDLLAGACAAMAANSNFFEIALIGIFGVVWLFFSLLLRRQLKEMAKRISGVALGGLIVCVLGCVYYWHAFGRPTNIFYPTLSMAYRQGNGGAKQWRTPGVSWIATQIQVLMPVFLVACCLLVGRWRRITVTHWVVLSFGIAVTAFYYAEQFLLASNILEFFYYFSYLMPAVFLMLAYLWQMLWEETGRRTPAFITLGLTALLAQWALSTWCGWALPDLNFSRWLALAVVTALVVFLATRERRLPFVQDKLPWLGLVLLSGFFSAGMANYGRITGSGPPLRNVETDVYGVAVQFIRAVPKLADHPGTILFWYSNRASSIGSIQSTYLWGYSKLNADLPEDPGLPHLGELQLRLLSNPDVRYLGLLAGSEEELSQGLAALTREAVEFKRLDHRVLASGSYRIYFQLVELKHAETR